MATVAMLERAREPKADPEPGREELTSLYEASAEGLWSYVLRLTGDPTAADDVTQESFLRMIARADWSLEPSRQKAYLYRIATNLVRDRWRRWRRHDRWQAAQEAAVARDSGAGKEARLDVDAALTHLTPRQRALVWLAYAEGHTHVEIGEILGLRPTSVRVLLHRARRKLARWLESDGGKKA